jgi:hypothetical protein
VTQLPMYLFTGSPEWWDADRAPRRLGRRFAPVRPVENGLSGVGCTLTAAAGAIRTTVNHRVDNQLRRPAVANRCRHRSGGLRARFPPVADHGAHSRCAPALPAGRSSARRVRGRPWTRATCEPRDHDARNRARTRPPRRRRRCRHHRSRQLVIDTIPPCRADRAGRRRDRQRTRGRVRFPRGEPGAAGRVARGPDAGRSATAARPGAVVGDSPNCFAYGRGGLGISDRGTSWELGIDSWELI